MASDGCVILRQPGPLKLGSDWAPHHSRAFRRCLPRALETAPCHPRNQRRRRPPPVPPPIAARRSTRRRSLEENREACIGDAVAWCIAHGASYAAPVETGEPASLSFSHAPFALAPFPFPRSEYERLVAMQPTFNRLVELVAEDSEWLEATLAQTAASDAFTRRLLELRRSSPRRQALGSLT